MMAKNYFWLVVALTCFAPRVAAQVSSGTAFAVAPGLLITNQHVVAGCSFIEVIAADGRRTGSVVDADTQIDLALLRVSGIKGTTARLRNPRNVRLGESVMVFGFPLAGSLTSKIEASIAAYAVPFSLANHRVTQMRPKPHQVSLL